MNEKYALTHLLVRLRGGERTHHVFAAAQTMCLIVYSHSCLKARVLCEHGRVRRYRSDNESIQGMLRNYLSFARAFINRIAVMSIMNDE